MDSVKKEKEGTAEGLKFLSETLATIEELLANRTFQIPSSKPAIESLAGDLPLTKLSLLNGLFRAYSEIIAGAEPSITVRTESRLLKKAMDRWGLRAADSIPGDIEDYLEKEHLIEIYDQDGIQLYRNFEFFRHCSYSLLELALINWTTLYERPTRINELIQEKLVQMFQTGRMISPGDIPVHILRERYLASKKAYLIKVKRGLPLVSIADSNRKAFLSVISAELIATGTEADKIQYI